MKRPVESEYTSLVAYTRALEAYCDSLTQTEKEPAFHGFMDEQQCCVNICYTPWAAGGPNNKLPAAYYTAPPKRTWVGLTGFEQKELMAMNARDAVFATEAKLKEKNT